MSKNLVTKSIYDFVDAMQKGYIKEEKIKKNKDFSKGVNAIITATTFIKMQIKIFEKIEKELVENAHMAGQRNAGIDPSAHSALAYYNEV